MQWELFLNVYSVMRHSPKCSKVVLIFFFTSIVKSIGPALPPALGQERQAVLILLWAWRRVRLNTQLLLKPSSLPRRLFSHWPLEAGAVTSPLPWDGYVLVHPLLCQRRSRSVIFHYCCLSNVSILVTFKNACSSCHHWDLKKLRSSFPDQNLHEGLKPWGSGR